MDLPASVSALGEQLHATDHIAPEPALFHDPDVFAAERARIFSLPLMAVDHETRLSADGHYFRCDAAHRSLLVTRENGGRLHALRNVCIHAGYPVCDMEEGAAERLICPYHGWEYSLDGRLVEPELSSRIDPSRLRLPAYPVHVRNGLVFINLSGDGGSVEQEIDAVPDWLAEARVTRRARYSTTWNWKFTHRFLHSSPQLFFDDLPGNWLEFGPLSFMIAERQHAALFRVIPKSAEQTDFEMIEMSAGEGRGLAAPPDAAIADTLRRADTTPSWFDRRFADWYWSLMSVGE
jgi:nitrite reductase/ring-hydroxylating ferredoxin subunit